MKIDLDHQLRALDGEGLKDQQEKPLMMRSILTNALLDPKESKDITGEEKAKRYNLAFDISSATKFIDLDIDSLKKIKDLVGKVYTPIIVGQVWEILEKGHNPLTKQKGQGYIP